MKRTAVVLLAAALVPPAAGQQPAGSVKREVDVVVRSVLVTATDSKGNPVSLPPAPTDLEVLEDGARVVVVGVDPVLGGATVAGTPAADPAAPASSNVPASTPSPMRRTKQVLYVDTAFLRQNSVKEVAKTFQAQLPKLLAIGPLEIVVADPSPRVWFASSGSDAALRDALDALRAKVPGRDRVVSLRRETVSVLGNDPRATRQVTARRATGSAAGGFARSQGRQEASLLRDAMARLGRWASALPTTEPGIVYLANDGFEVDSFEFYGNTDDERDASAGAGRQEVSTTVIAAFGRTVQSLQAGGWTAVPIAFNAATAADGPSSAEFAGRDRIYRTTDTQAGGAGPALLAHGLDSLRAYADATGGEVLVSADQLALAASRLASRWIVSWQAEKVLDGRLHQVEVRSRLEGLVVRATKAFPAGTPEASSAARAMEAMEGSEANGGLPIEVGLSTPAPTRKTDRLGATLTVKATLEDLKPVLAKTGAPHMRVTVAVEIPSSLPFVWHVEKEVPKDFGKGWIYEAPIEWPKGARTVAVVVEELSTGSWASSTGKLPLTP